MSTSTLKNIYAPAASTTRGKATHLGGDPKGKNFLYACGSSIVIRNIEDPLKCEMYNEHQFQTTVARYAPSGFYIASGDITGNLRIWDTTQKEHILKIELKIISGPILDLQWSEDSKRIIAVGEGKERFGSVFLFDSGSSVGEITGHSKPIGSCDFKQTRPYRVVTGGEDNVSCWFEGPPFKFNKSLKDHTRFVNCVRFSPDGTKLLTVSSDKTGVIYDGKTGEKLRTLNTTGAHSAGIYSCSWASDSKRVLTASADKTCKLWDSETGDLIKTFNVSENPQVEDQQVGSVWVGNEIITLSLNGSFTYLDQEAPNAPKRVVRGHNKFITALAYDAKNNHIYSGSYDALILRWDEKTGQTEPMIGKGHTNQVNKLYVQGDNLISSGMDDTVRITPLHSREYSTSISLDANPVDIAVSKKSDLVFAAINGFVVVIQGGKVIHKHAASYQPSAIALSADETTLAVGGKDNAVYIYAFGGVSLTEKTVLKQHRGAISCLSFSQDGKYLASGDVNREIFVWNTSDNSLFIRDWVFHNARVNTIVWSNDSLHLASSSLDGTVIVWDVQKSGNRIVVKEASKGGVNSVIWIDDNTIACGGQDCSVKTFTLKY